MRQFNFLSALAAVSTLVSPINALVSNSSINSQTRLAYAGPNGMMVSWNTFAHIDKPTVLYGLSPYEMTSVATSNVSVTYETSLTYNNHVKITELKPDTMYYYLPTTLMKTNDSSPGPFTFKTSKPAGDMTPYSIAVVVDMGTMGPEGLYTSAGTGVAANNILKPGETNTVQSLTSAVDQFEFLWHPGDIAYADTWLKEEIQGFEPNTTIADGYKVYESILEEFYDEMTPITTLKPYMVGPGNHEANCDNGRTTDKADNITYTADICVPGQTNFTGYINHFRMPSAESGGTGNFWYSFDFGMTHYVQFDTETDLGHGLIAPDSPQGGTEDSGPFALANAQANWLAADLAAVDRSKTPWVVVAGHRPWYSSGSICTTCQEAFEAVLYQNEVDLVMSGHFHVYERNAPVTLNGTADPAELNNPRSPWYITNGAAGHYDGLDSFTPPLASYQRFGLSTNDGIYGWSKLTFHNCTHLTHEFINSANATVLDTATLYKNRTCGGGNGGGKSSSSSTVSTLPTSSKTYPNSTSTAGSHPTTGSSSVSLTTSTVYTTKTFTTTSCAPTVTNCPARSTTVITETIPLYTTVCPVSASSSPSQPTSVPISASSSNVVSTVPMTISVVYSTTLITVTSCAATVTKCPARSTQVLTSTIALYTTVCPVSEAGSISTSSPAKTASPIVPVPVSVSSVNSGTSSLPTSVETVSVVPVASSPVAVSSAAGASKPASSPAGAVSQATSAGSAKPTSLGTSGNATSAGATGSKTTSPVPLQITNAAGVSASASYSGLFVVIAGLLALF